MRRATVLPTLTLAIPGILAAILGHLKLVSTEASYSYRTVDAGMFYLLLGLALVAAAWQWKEGRRSATNQSGESHR